MVTAPVPARRAEGRSLRAPGAILLVSCYELGHQPLGIASPAAFLRRAGFAPAALDLSVEPFDRERVARARLVCLSVPMHTALRLGVRAAAQVREVNPAAHVCFHGLYAALNAEWLLAHGADSAVGGESEAALVALAEALEAEGPSGGAMAPDPDAAGPAAHASRAGAGASGPPAPGPPAAARPAIPAGLSVRGRPAAPVLERLDFAPPARDLLPPLERYARLEGEDGHAVAGYTEATRGCRHMCLHCPIPPVYGGRFFAVPVATVLDDVRRQAAMGARHITFGDPDFLNAPTHALRVVRAVHAELPDLTFDFTAKIEHVLEHRALFPELVGCGALFMVSAVESLSDTVLANLAKGHTRADVFTALGIVREAGLVLRPSLVAFTPWTTLDDYLEVLEVVEREGLVDCVDPVQFSIRLLVPPGSLLLGSAALRPHMGAFDPASLGHDWRHPDPRMDRLHRAVSERVSAATLAGEDHRDTFLGLRELAWAAAGRPRPASHGAGRATARRHRVPRLTEPWFC